MKQFGMLRKYDDSQEYLIQHPHLTCEETANYLVIWCINLEMEEVRFCLLQCIQFYGKRFSVMVAANMLENALLCLRST